MNARSGRSLHPPRKNRLTFALGAQGLPQHGDARGLARHVAAGRDGGLRFVPARPLAEVAVDRGPRPCLCVPCVYQACGRLADNCRRPSRWR
jgi:hypothetical protein